MRFVVGMNAGFAHEPNNTFNHKCVRFLEQMGIDPVLISNAIRHPRAYVNRSGVPDAVVTAGTDLSPGFCRAQPAGSESWSDPRDRLETQLFQLASASDPTVPRRLSRNAVHQCLLWGAPVEDFNVCPITMVDHVAHPHHHTCTDPAMRHLFGLDDFVINSVRGQRITAHSLAPCHRAFTVSNADDLVEGLPHPAHPIPGGHWYPEKRAESPEGHSQLHRGSPTRSLSAQERIS